MVRLGLSVTIVGLAMVAYGIYMNRTQDEIGANIGAGLLILEGLGVAAVGATVAFVSVIRRLRRS